MRLIALTALLYTTTGLRGQYSTVPVWQVTAMRDITPEGVIASGPQWSPDGMWISYSGPKGDGIGIVRPDGSDWRTVTREPLSGYRHSWSPDSSRLAFRTRRVDAGGKAYAVRVVSPAGEVESTSEWTKTAQPPVWQRGPAGMRWICQAGTNEMAGPWLPCTLATPVPPRPGPPLLYYYNQRLHSGPDSGDLLPMRAAGVSFGAQWSRDGKRVVFDAGDTVATGDGIRGLSTVLLCPGQHPSWSPDGKWIVYQMTQDHTHAGNDTLAHTGGTSPHRHDGQTNHQIVEADLWIIAADGSVRFQLTHTPDVLEVEPQWSPDGSMIVCRTEREGKILMLRLGPVAGEKTK